MIRDFNKIVGAMKAEAKATEKTFLNIASFMALLCIKFMFYGQYHFYWPAVSILLHMRHGQNT